MISLFNVLIIVFGLFAISRVVLRVRDRQLNYGQAVFWTVAWALVMLITVLPNVSTAIAKLFGVGRGADFLVYISIVLLFYMMFRMYVRMEKQNEELTNLVRKLAQEKAKK